MSRPQTAPAARQLHVAPDQYQADRTACAVHVAASLLWIIQAASIAWAAQGLMEGQGMARVWPAALALLLTGVIRSLAEAWASRRLFQKARTYLTVLREQAVTTLAARSPLDLRRVPAGEAASILAEQAESILPYLVRYLPVRQKLMMQPWLIAAAVAWYSWIAALVLLVAAPVIPLFMALVGWRAKAASEALLLEHGGMNAFLLDRLKGMTTLRALDAVPLTAGRLDAAALSLRQRTMRVLRIAFLSSAVLELFSALGVALVAVYIGFHLLGQVPYGTWGTPLTLGQGLFILLLAPAFFEPLRELSAVWHDRATGISALEALQSLGRRGSKLADVPSGAPSAPDTATQPLIVLNQVSLRHPGAAKPIIEDLSLVVGKGEWVALTGPSGSGKSSMLAALAGLLAVQAGTLQVGVPRKCIGWVSQQPHLFATSIARNVTLGRRFSREAVDRALVTACLDQVESARAGNFLGEGGVGLSGGENVRLALARVALDPQVELILADEPTAHLDRQAAAGVTAALLDIARNKTLVVATHDPLLIAAMARQISMDRAAPGSCGTPCREEAPCYPA
ncbi:thiol reductant ABC exporter subunit CydD [Pseudomonas qingdaonensis]|uniref:Thiol reductant ABC exporter subunit CydD n=1 Tax=Pseudomonas qingdaonensis TaxID=2056231 RepID=A0ABX8DWG1_9PSED|nr:thiol reductant ABC exporter subunit CydD [Pseudomonas qingdaonensis]QVL20339.1 thiol reductant ABC exporter subunit CydD [Pseudomonas qingdaonensis]